MPRSFAIILLPTLVAVALTLTGGCSQRHAQELTSTMFKLGNDRSCGLVEANYAAAQAMAPTLQTRLTPEAGVVVVPFRAVDTATVSPLDTIIPQQIGSKLAQLGFRPLSRAPGATHRSAHARLGGSYIVAHDVLVINARVVRVSDGAVLAGHDYELPLNANLRSLLAVAEPLPATTPSVQTSFTRSDS